MSDLLDNIGFIPDDAKLLPLGDCIDLIIDHRGKTPKKLGSDWSNDGVKVISAKNVHDGKLSNQDDIRHVPFNIYKKWMRQDLKKGDCLLASEGATLGQNLFWDFDFPVVLGQRLFCIRTNPDILDPKYFYSFVTTSLFQGQIHGRASGTSVFGLRQTELLKMVVPIIPMDRQKLIGEIHYTINKKIDLLHRNNKTLEQLAETLFRQWFVEEADDSWELSVVGHNFETKGGGTPSTTDSTLWDGDIFWTSPRDLSANNNVFLKQTQRTITPEGLKKISSGLLPKGTVLLSSRAPIGYLAIAEVPLAINQGYIACLPNKRYSSWYLHNWLKLNMDTIHSVANGSTFMEISKSTFRALEFVVPERGRLTRYNDLAESWYQKLLLNENQIRQLETIRDTLLPKLISGTVKVVHLKEINLNTLSS